MSRNKCSNHPHPHSMWLRSSTMSGLPKRRLAAARASLAVMPAARFSCCRKSRCRRISSSMSSSNRSRRSSILSRLPNSNNHCITDRSLQPAFFKPLTLQADCSYFFLFIVRSFHSIESSITQSDKSIRSKFDGGAGFNFVSTSSYFKKPLFQKLLCRKSVYRKLLHQSPMHQKPLCQKRLCQTPVREKPCAKALASNRLDHSNHRPKHPVELRLLNGQLLSPRRGELVISGAPVAGGRAPCCRHPALDEHSLQCRIERSFFNLQNLFGDLLNGIGNLVSVHLSGAGQGLQDHLIECAGGNLVSLQVRLRGIV